jgi:nucleotide-binding universal stress UspA family protein
VGSDEAGELARIVGPVTHHLSRHAGCSVLVVRS